MFWRLVLAVSVILFLGHVIRHAEKLFGKRDVRRIDRDEADGRVLDTGNFCAGRKIVGRTKCLLLSRLCNIRGYRRDGTIRLTAGGAPTDARGTRSTGKTIAFSVNNPSPLFCRSMRSISTSTARLPMARKG